MKTKNLTRRMKEFIARIGLNPDEWQFIKNTPTVFIIVNKTSKEEKSYDKSNYENIYF